MLRYIKLYIQNVIFLSVIPAGHNGSQQPIAQLPADKGKDKKAEAKPGPAESPRVTPCKQFTNIFIVGGRDFLATTGRTAAFLANIGILRAVPASGQLAYASISAATAALTVIVGAFYAGKTAGTKAPPPGAKDDQKAEHAQRTERGKKAVVFMGVSTLLALGGSAGLAHHLSGNRGLVIALMGASNLVFGNLTRDTIAAVGDYLRESSQWGVRAIDLAIRGSDAEKALKAKLDNCALMVACIGYTFMLYSSGVFMNNLRENDSFEGYVSDQREIHPSNCLGDAVDVGHLLANFKSIEAVAFGAQEIMDIMFGTASRHLIAHYLGLEYYLPGGKAEPRSFSNLLSPAIRNELGHHIIRATQMRTFLGSVCGLLMQITNWQIIPKTPDKPSIPFNADDRKSLVLMPGELTVTRGAGFYNRSVPLQLFPYNETIESKLHRDPIGYCPADIAVRGNSSISPAIAQAFEMPCSLLDSIQVAFQAVGQMTIGAWNGSAAVSGTLLPDIAKLGEAIQACMTDNSSFPFNSSSSSNFSQPPTLVIEGNQWVLARAADVIATLKPPRSSSSIPEPLVRLLLIPTEARGFLVRKLAEYSNTRTEYPKQVSGSPADRAGDRVHPQREPQGEGQSEEQSEEQSVELTAHDNKRGHPSQLRSEDFDSKGGQPLNQGHQSVVVHLLNQGQQSPSQGESPPARGERKGEADGVPQPDDGDNSRWRVVDKPQDPLRHSPVSSVRSVSSVDSQSPPPVNIGASPPSEKHLSPHGNRDGDGIV